MTVRVRELRECKRVEEREGEREAEADGKKVLQVDSV